MEELPAAPSALQPEPCGIRGALDAKEGAQGGFPVKVRCRKDVYGKEEDVRQGGLPEGLPGGGNKEGEEKKDPCKKEVDLDPCQGELDFLLWPVRHLLRLTGDAGADGEVPKKQDGEIPQGVTVGEPCRKMSDLVQKQRQKKERIVERQDKRPACGGIEELQKKARGKKKRRRDGEGELDSPAERGDIRSSLRNQKEDKAVDAIPGLHKAGGLQKAVGDKLRDDVISVVNEGWRKGKRSPPVCMKERMENVRIDGKEIPIGVLRIAVHGIQVLWKIRIGVLRCLILFQFHTLPEHRIHGAASLLQDAL